MLLAPPGAAVAAGMAAEWLDFRALRYPLLLMMLLAVVATALARESRREIRSGFAAREFLLIIGIGVATWGAAETLYVVIHALRGEPFEAERFGPQWAQALGLIAVHAVVLGATTGAVAAVIVRLRGWWLARA
jgi:hypothetical protein